MKQKNTITPAEKLNPLTPLPAYPNIDIDPDEVFDRKAQDWTEALIPLTEQENANIAKYNANLPAINTVLANMPDINTVASIDVEVSRVATSADNIDRVHTSIEKVDRVNDSIVAVDRVNTSIEAVDRVNESIEEVDRIFESIIALDEVGSNIVAVTNVHSNMGAVTTISTNMSAVTTTSTSIEDVINTSTNMDAVKAAPTHAAEAKYWAEFAKDVVDIGPASETESGIIRIATADEVKAGTSTLLAITPATLHNRLKTAVNTAQTYYFANTGGF